MAAGLDEALDIIGPSSFTIAGVTYSGVLNQFTSSRKLEIGGFLGVFDATLLCERSAFTETPGTPLERSLDGLLLVIDGRTFIIAKASMDETSVTLGLRHPE